jgi:isochorismate synthase EntC
MSTLLALSAAQLDELQARLDRLADGAPGGALLSVTLDLGAGRCDWLHRQPAAREFCYWAQPEAGLHRLGLGRAVVCTSAGPARFTAVQAAHAGIAADWRHDAGGSPHKPVACLGFAFDDDTRSAHRRGQRPFAGASWDVPAPSAAGSELPNAQLGVAAVLLTSADGRISATFTTPARNRAGAADRWRQLLIAQPLPPLPATGRRPVGDLAERAWHARVDRALAAIAAGELD